MTPLTDDERDEVARTMWVVGGVLRALNCHDEDIYQDGCLLLCRLVKKKPELHNATFSTYAWKYLYFALRHKICSEREKQEYEPIENMIFLPSEDVVSPVFDGDGEDGALLNDLQSTLNDAEREFLFLLVNCTPYREMLRTLKINARQAHTIRESIQEKAKKIMGIKNDPPANSFCTELKNENPKS